jgi:hypothetical protein
MTRRAHRGAHGRPQPDGPQPFATLVELTFHKHKIEHWIRFGRKSYEQILDRRRSIVGFASNSVFAFVRWAAGEHGTLRGALVFPSAGFARFCVPKVRAMCARYRRPARSD